MARNTNPTPRSATSHKQTSNKTSTKQTAAQRTSHTINRPRHVIDASLKRRARRLITNNSIPKQTRNMILYALKIEDPYLDQVVKRVESGELTIRSLHAE